MSVSTSASQTLWTGLFIKFLIYLRKSSGFTFFSWKESHFCRPSLMWNCPMQILKAFMIVRKSYNCYLQKLKDWIHCSSLVEKIIKCLLLLGQNKDSIESLVKIYTRNCIWAKELQHYYYKKTEKIFFACQNLVVRLHHPHPSRSASGSACLYHH